MGHQPSIRREPREHPDRALRVTNAHLLELYRKLEQQVIEQAAKLEKLRLDLEMFIARWTNRPPPP